MARMCLQASERVDIFAPETIMRMSLRYSELHFYVATPIIHRESVTVQEILWLIYA